MNTIPVDFPLPDRETPAAAAAELREAVQGMLRVLDQLPKTMAVNRALIQFEKIAMASEGVPPT